MTLLSTLLWIVAIAVLVAAIAFFVLYGVFKRVVWLVLGIVFVAVPALLGGLFLLAGLTASFF